MARKGREGEERRGGGRRGRGRGRRDGGLEERGEGGVELEGFKLGDPALIHPLCSRLR